MTLSAEQMAVRATGIGASDIGAVAGLSPYASPMDVWLVKRGLAEVPQTDAMARGHQLEPAVASMYEAEHLAPGEALRHPAGTLRHPRYPWALATPDRLVVDPLADATVRLVEIKAVGWRSARYWGAEHDEVPPWYRAQIAWQMAVTGVEACDLAAFIGGEELRVYRIERDREMEAALLQIGRDFWRCVEEGREPAVDGSEAWRSYLEARFPSARQVLRAATPEADEIAARLADARARREAAEADAERAANELRALIGDAEGIEGRGWRATWKSPAKGTPRWKEIATALGADAHPEVVSQHTAAPSRRFTFTERSSS